MARRILILITIALVAGALAPGRFDPPADEITIVDWAQIQSQIDQHQHTAVLEEDGSYRARHHRFDWTIRFDGRGLEVKPDEGDWVWGLELLGFGVEGAVAKVEGKARIEAEKNRVVYGWDDALEEWYVAEGRGIEHGFTVKERPEGEGERLVFELAVRGGLEAREAGGRGLAFVDASGEEIVRYDGLKVWDANGAELPARLEAGSLGLVKIVVSDGGARYPITVDPIIQRAYLKAPNAEMDDFFGYSVAISENTLIVGAPREDSSGTGTSSLDDNSTTNSGAVYVFERVSGTWRQRGYLKASNADAGDRFGQAVAASPNAVVIGAAYEDGSGTGVDPAADNAAGNSGAAYVFERVDGAWTQHAYLKASNTGVDDRFGVSVGISKDKIVIGAHSEDGSGKGVNPADDDAASDSGAAYLFERVGSGWVQAAYLKASNADAGDLFGQSVEVSGDTVVVGAYLEDGSGTGVNPPDDDGADDSGAAYVFQGTVGVWSQQAYLKASNTGERDQFGSSVAVSETAIVVGANFESGSGMSIAPQSDELANRSGAAYVFEQTGGSWNQEAYLKASNAGEYDQFGSSVAVSETTIVVGALFESGSGTGVNPQYDDGATWSGAAYVFERTSGSWAQQAYLKWPISSFVDVLFGFSVSVSSGTVVVGTYHESGSGRGVNPPDDDDADRSGATYVFEPVVLSALATFTNGHWLIDRNGDGIYDPIEELFGWGVNGSTPLMGDWNGDGYRDLGVFSEGLWFLDLNGDRLFDPASEIKGWGLAGWTPITGDWNGDGKTDLGVIDPATMTWFLDLNGDFAFDAATEIRGWGSVGNKPVVGDWDGDGTDDIGVFADGTWFRDLNGDGAFAPGTEQQGWGAPGWLPVVGDWNGDGAADMGVIAPATMTWFLDLNGDGAFDPGAEIVGWGSPGNRPVVADWDGDGDDDIGVVAGSAWFIDSNGDRLFDPAMEIRSWGDAGWTPVPGPWK